MYISNLRIVERSYHMDALYAFLLSKSDSNGCQPRRIDECIYTGYRPPVSIFRFVSNPATPTPQGQGSLKSKHHPTLRHQQSSPTNIPPSTRSLEPSLKSFQTPPTASGWLPAFEEEGASSTKPPPEAIISEKNEYRMYQLLYRAAVLMI